jgi:hypothetical protein
MFRTLLFRGCLILLIGSMSKFTWAANDVVSGSSPPKDTPRISVANPNVQNRVHNAGKMCMDITNRGYFGNDSPNGPFTPLDDPCHPGVWAPQCEFPCGSGQQYLYMASLWVGALIVEQGFETKRVSVGTDGWIADLNEMFPGEGVNDGIVERSTRPGYYNCFGKLVSSPDAVSDQDFLCAYTDTLRDRFWVPNDPQDGPHRPLGIKITQTSYSFSQSFAQDFILIDFEFENIASNYLKNLYIGFYCDSDVGSITEQPDWHQDDICGFVRYFYFERADGTPDSVLIDVAYIADNDGRPYNRCSGSDFTSPNVAGTRVIRAPNPRLETSFNWWISNQDVTLDYGPSWEAYALRDSNGGGWTKDFGTPMGDERKYFVLSNEEFDFDQVYVDDPEYIRLHPQMLHDSIPKAWMQPDAANAADLADGYDTRYLLSWGPLGIRDYKDQSGRWIYRLNPGEKFNMTIGYVGGENFHNVNHPQPSCTNIDPSLFDFSDLRNNAYWAQRVYDNPMRDTPQWDWGNDHDPNIIDADGSQGDGILDTGDGWYGEDVGTDGLYAELKAGEDSVAVWYFRGTAEFQVFAGWYKGPDADGSERNGRIDAVSNPNLSWAHTEDDIIPERLYYTHPKYRYWDEGWMALNGKLDEGDGLPDFTGPPPPPIPGLQHHYPNTRNAAEIVGGIVTASGNTGGLGFEIRGNTIFLRWSKKPSEDPTYQDPFSLVQDFEGYRIYAAKSNDENAYSLLAEFDKIDWAYFSESYDSLATIPMTDSIQNGPDSLINGIRCILKPFGSNMGMSSIQVDDSTYEFAIRDAQPLWPRYYSVTAYDFGDPKSGLGPLETPATANAILLAPAGNPKQPVRAVPNPYRAYLDYTTPHSGGLSWENQNDGTVDFYPQVDRRIEFVNLPLQCLIRIFTVSGDLVAIVPHNVEGDQSRWVSEYSERWDLNSRNKQQVVSGLYLFSVEDKTSEGGGHIDTGKFVIIR